MTHVLVVDDEAKMREGLCAAVEETGLMAYGAANAEDALQQITRRSFAICISDLRLPKMGGLELVHRIREVSPQTMTIIITAYGDRDTAIGALRAGATDYVLKPFAFEAMLQKLRNLIEYQALAMEVRKLRRIAQSSAPSMVGSSPAMEEVRQLIRRVAASKSPVLVIGENGTGKELVARAIHQASGNASEPFTTVNCAALDATHLESELFGYSPGTQNGATGDQRGTLIAAGKGTIFLDEIVNMPNVLQARLLRALQNRRVQPVGSLESSPLEARVIAALNRDAESEVASGRLREDLSFRFAMHIEVPALRERREDIPALVDHFVTKYNQEMGRSFVGVSQQALQRMVGYYWRGNVRELENAVERAMIIADGNVLRVHHLPEPVRDAAPIAPDSLLRLNTALWQFERSHIHRVLNHFEGDKKKTADALGISLSSVYRKLASEPPGPDPDPDVE